MNRVAYKQKLPLTVLETGKSEIKAPEDLASDEDFLSGSHEILLALPLHGTRGKNLPWSSVKRTLISLPGDLITSQRAQPPNSITLRVKVFNI
jgi:hypothetical protein